MLSDPVTTNSVGCMKFLFSSQKEPNLFPVSRSTPHATGKDRFLSTSNAFSRGSPVAAVEQNNCKVRFDV